MAKHTAVFGIYSTRLAAENAIEVLRAEGFTNTDISVLFPDESVGGHDMGTEKATKAPEGAATGAGAGAVVGGALGWLVGVGALAIPGLGPFIAAGPIMATLAGIGLGGAVGTLTGGLVGMGVPEYEAKRYESRLARGGVLLSVHAADSDWADRAEKALQRTGAEDISTSSESEAPEEAVTGDRKRRPVKGDTW